VVRRWETRIAYRLWWGYLLENDHLGDREGGRRIALRRIFGCVGGKWMEHADDRVQWWVYY